MNVKNKPDLSFRNLFSVCLALFVGKGISRQRKKKRLELCSQCDLLTFDHFGRPRCGICGCKLKGDNALVDLLRYEETEWYGCKHPDGSVWKKNGV